MSKQIKRKEFFEIIALPPIKLVPVGFTLTQHLQPMELFVLDPGDNAQQPKSIQLGDVYQCQSGLYGREAFTDSHTGRRFERDVAVITLRMGYSS